MKPFARDLQVMELGEGSVVAGYRVGASVLRRSSDERVHAAQSPKDEPATIVFARVEDAEREGRARFRRFARARARVEHPALIRVHEYGQLDSFRYVVTDPYPRRSLADVLDEGPLAPRRAVDLLAPVAAALDAAHASGVVHQSLAAESLLVAGDRLVVDAFGLAGGGVDPVFGSSRGGAQPLHASPEAGRADPLEPSSNVYSLTAILVHALTGRPPFGGEAATVVYAHLTEPPPRPSESDGLVRDIDAVVAAGMAKEADARPAKALALIQAAATALDVPFHPLQAGPIRSSVRRRPRLAALRDLRPRKVPSIRLPRQDAPVPEKRENATPQAGEALQFEPPPVPPAPKRRLPAVPRNGSDPAIKPPTKRIGAPAPPQPAPQPPKEAGTADTGPGRTTPAGKPPEAKPASETATPKPQRSEPAKAKPAAEESPAAKAKPAPAVKQPPAAKAKPVAKEAPAVKEPPAAKESPAAKAQPAAKEPPAAKTKPAAKEPPAARAKPAAKAPPSANAPPAAKPAPKPARRGPAPAGGQRRPGAARERRRHARSAERAAKTARAGRTPKAETAPARKALARLAGNRMRLAAVAGALAVVGIGLGVLLASGGEEAPPARPDPALAANVRAIDTLEQRRLDLRAELADAITAPAQVEAATALAAAYESVGEAARSRPLSAAAADAAQAYERLASAARREDGGDFAAASRAVDVAERDFQAATARAIGGR